MSNKNRSMAAKERKVKQYDAAAFKRMYGDYCASDYVEGRREYAPPLHSAYTSDVAPGFSTIYKRDGKSLHEKRLSNCVSKLMSKEAIVIWAYREQAYYMWSERKDNLQKVPTIVAKRMILFTGDPSEYNRYFACGRMSRG